MVLDHEIREKPCSWTCDLFTVPRPSSATAAALGDSNSKKPASWPPSAAAIGSRKPLARQFGSGLPTPAHRLLDKRADLDQHSADLPRSQLARRHFVTSPEAGSSHRRKKAPKRFPF